MKTTVKVAWLIRKLEENREKHLATFDRAAVAYRAKVIETMEKNLADARSGREVRTFIHLSQPANQTGDYDRVLLMLAAMVPDTIEITEQDFQQYVQDQWAWKQAWTTTNATYGVEE